MQALRCQVGVAQCRKIQAQLLKYCLDISLIEAAMQHPLFWKKVPQFLEKYNIALLAEDNPAKKEKLFREFQGNLHSTICFLANNLSQVDKTERVDPTRKATKHPKYGDKKRGKCKSAVISYKRLRILAAIYYNPEISLQELKKISLLQKQNFTIAIEQLQKSHLITKKEDSFELTEKGKKLIISQLCTLIHRPLQNPCNTQYIVVPSRITEAIELLEAYQEVVSKLSRIEWHSPKIYQAIERHNIIWLRDKVRDVVDDLSIQLPGPYLMKCLLKSLSAGERTQKCLEKNIEDEKLRELVTHVIIEEKLNLRLSFWLIRSVRRLENRKVVWLQDIYGILNWIRKIEAKRRSCRIRE